MPEHGDSLCLDFYYYNAAADTAYWVAIWGVDGGTPVDSLSNKPQLAWRYKAITVPASFFWSGFRFRFRNLCSLDANPKAGIVGNTDHWHIDVVNLANGRQASVKTRRDVAFVNPATSLLKEYQAMPFRHYRPSDMATSTRVTITNRYTERLPFSYQYRIYDETGNVVDTSDGGYDNVNQFFPNGIYHSKSPAVNFRYPAMDRPRHFTIRHIVSEGVAGDDYKQNDTITFRQQFSNYFAYDDGTPENGYGLTSTSSRMYLACRYRTAVTDTLSAVDLYFNHTRGDENAGIYFNLCVWTVDDTIPDSLIYRSATKYNTSACSFNTFCTYTLDTTLVLPAGNYFIGIEQSGNSYINLGFDRNNDNYRKTYYRTTSHWQQSILGGTVMMRPRMGSVKLLDIQQPQQQSHPLGIACYPNPTTGLLTMKTAEPCDNLKIDIYNLRGQLCGSYTGTTTINLSNLPPSLYLLRATNGHSTETAKIILSY